MIPGDRDSCDDGLLRRRLRVAALEDGHVRLTGTRASACNGCAARARCGPGALAEMIGGAQGLRLPQTLPLDVGDEVIVTMESGAFLNGVLRADLLPAAALAVAALAGLALELPDAVTAALCLPALALAFLPLARVGRGRSPDPALRIESRLPAGRS